MSIVFGHMKMPVDGGVFRHGKEEERGNEVLKRVPASKKLSEFIWLQSRWIKINKFH